MNILFGKTFGLGNACMAIPVIRAIATLGKIDVLIGSTPDDVGASEVLDYLKKDGSIGEIYDNNALSAGVYDVSIMSIPFDGRWKCGIHFNSRFEVDGRTRPDSTTTGLISWKRHEIEYQMDNACALGYRGSIPSTSFLPSARQQKKIYFGVGYKKDATGFWKVKHWGNDNFAKLALMIRDNIPGWEVVTSGDHLDRLHSVYPIIKKSDAFVKCSMKTSLKDAFEVIQTCSACISNDTGMMHVAASLGIPTIGLFQMENAAVKNRPWGPNGFVIKNASVEQAFEMLKEKIDGLA